MKKQNGFTITELLISISIATILNLVLITIMVDYYGDILRSQATAELAIESQTVLRKMVEDTRLADSIHTTNLITDPNAPSGGWITSDPSNVLIVANPAITSTRSIIYNPADSYPYEDEVIYFNTGTDMYRRILKNTDATGNIAVTTCPPAAVSATCPADLKLSSYLTNLTFTFYDINNVSTSNAALARSISISISLQRKIYGRTIDFTNTVRTTLRNY